MDLCIVCNTRPVFVKKRKLCKLCYGRLMGNNGNTKKTSGEDAKNPREIEFVKNYFAHENWIHHPATFNLNHTSYTPDFYDGKRNVFIEVSGTRQAYHKNKDKYASFKKIFPLIKFEVRTMDGELLAMNNNKIIWPDSENYNFPIHKTLKKSGLNQKQLSEKTGIGQSQVSHVVDKAPSVLNFKFLTALKAIGWSQRELARQTGITEARISNIMNKKWNPSEEEKQKIETALSKKIWR